MIYDEQSTARIDRVYAPVEDEQRAKVLWVAAPGVRPAPHQLLRQVRLQLLPPVSLDTYGRQHLVGLTHQLKGGRGGGGRE